MKKRLTALALAVVPVFALLTVAAGCEQNDNIQRQEVERQEISDPEPVAPGQMIVE